MRRVVWLLALATACGDDDSGSGGDGGAGDGGVPANNGFVLVTAYNAMANGVSTTGGSVSATFSLQSSTPLCTDMTIGPCYLYMCPTTVPPVMYASGGVVTVTGLTQAVSLAPDGSKMYAPFTTQQSLMTGGENLTIRGAGADAPAFMLTVKAPNRVSITTPAKPAASGITIDRSVDFPVAWTGGGTGEVGIVIGSNQGYSMQCTYPAAAGTGTIPKAALAMMTAGAATFGASSQLLENVDMGDWRLWGEVFFSSVWTDQSLVGSTATLQ